MMSKHSRDMIAPMQIKPEHGWLVFYIVMLVLFAQSTYQYVQAPHTAYRIIAAAMSVIGLIFVSAKAWILIRARS
jgi:hypothetical protein